jgi:hypothetical protein
MTTLRNYPYWTAENLQDVIEQLRLITSLRKDDISVIQNLTNIFISGRKVGRVPSASNDVIDGDKIGDFNVTATYAYFLIDNAGTGEWRRVAVGSW